MREEFQRLIRFANESRPFLIFNAVLLFVLVNGVAAKLSCRADLSRDKLNSLTASSKEVMSRVEDPVLVEAYISTDVPGEILSLLHPVISQLEEFQRVGGDKVRVRIINPDSEEKRKLAESRGIQGMPLEEQKAAEVSTKLWYFGIYIQSGEKSALLGLDDGRLLDELEYRLLKEIKRLTRKEQASGLGLVRVPGALEARRWQNIKDQSKDNLYGFRTFAERDSGPMADVTLADPVPSTVDTLILAGLPRMEDKEIYYLDQFLMRGGNLVFLAKGFDFQMQETDPQLARLGIGGPGGGLATVPEADLKSVNAWLGKYGITVNGEILFEPQRPAPAHDVYEKRIREVPNPSWAVYSREDGQIKDDLPAVRYARQVVMPWFSGLTLNEKAQPQARYYTLVESTGSAVRRTSSQMDLREMLKVGQKGDTFVEPRPVAAMTRGRLTSAFSPDTIPKGVDKATFRAGQTGDTVSSVLVVGTAYLVSDMLLKNEINLQMFRINWAFLSNLIEAARGDNELAAARARVRTLDFLRDTPRFFEIIFSWFHVLAIPGILAVYGTLRLLRRNRRRGLEGGGS